MKWVTLNNIPNLKSCKAEIFYYSQHRCSSVSEQIEIFRAQAAQLTDVWHKAAENAKLHEPQTEGSERNLMINNMQEEDSAPVLNQTLSDPATQEELIPKDKPRHKRPLYDIYQEQFHGFQCHDPKRPLLNGALSPSDLLSGEDESFEEESSPLRDEKRKEKSFSPLE